MEWNVEWQDKKLNELMNKYNKFISLHRPNIERLWLIIQKMDHPNEEEKMEIMKLIISMMVETRDKTDKTSFRSWINSFFILILLFIIIMDTLIIFSPYI